MALHDENNHHEARDHHTHDHHANGRELTSGHDAAASANGSANGYAANGNAANGAGQSQALSRRGEGAGYAVPAGGTVRFNDYDTPDGFDLKQLGQILMRRRRVMLAVFVVVFASIVAWTLRATPLYRATAMIRITSNQDSGLSSIPGITALLPGPTANLAVITEIQLIDTEDLKQRALKSLPQDFQEILLERADVNVNDVRDSYLIAVSVTSPSRAASMAYADAICNTYVEESRDKNRAQMRQASVFIEQQLGKVSSELDKARAELEGFKLQSGVPNIVDVTHTQLGQLGQMESDLNAATADRRTAESRLNELQRQLRSLPRDVPFSTQLGDSPKSTAIQDQLAKLEVERVTAIKEFAPGAPEIREIDEQIAALQKRLSSETRNVAKQQTININPMWQATAQATADLRGQIAGLTAREKALSTGIVQARTRLAKLPATERRLATLMAKVQSLESAFASFSERKQTVDLQIIARQANGELAVSATPLKFAVSPRVTRNLVLGFILGVLLSLGIAVLIDMLDDRVHSDEDVRAASGLPVLTHVPEIKEIAHQTLLGLPGVGNRAPAGNSTALATTAKKGHYHASPLLESFRMLRANIMFSATVEPINSIVVTSSRPAEGKSSSALNLAIALALDGKSVILVDCDLRRPKVHELLGLRNSIGFTSVVTGEMTLSEALQTVEVPNLRVLTGGPVPPNPTELLNSRAGRACLQQLMREADFVILDSPPALVMADAQVVASQADAVLLVVSANEADKREVSRTTELMAQTGARILGTVLTKSDVTTGGYYNYHSYSQYYARPLEEDEQQDAAPVDAVDRTVVPPVNGSPVNGMNGHSTVENGMAQTEKKAEA